MPSSYAIGSPGQHGFSYLEVLLSAVLVTALLVPALQALQSGLAGGGNASAASRPLGLRSKMEEVLAKPFTKLYAESYLAGGNTTTSVSAAFSDVAGTAGRRLVVLYRYDASTKALSGNNTGLLFVNVYYEADGNTTGLATLVGQWW